MDDGVWFRRSRRRLLARAAPAATLAVLVAVLGELFLDHRWYDPFPALCPLLFSVGGTYAQLARQKGLPLRVTTGELLVTRPDGETLAIDRAALTVAEIRGRWWPRLVLAVDDPHRTRPVLSAYQWGELGFWSGARVRRPREFTVPLVGVEPDVDRLRAALAAPTDRRG
ncbi:hypothetical protein K7640_22260 [Micromonospora sp. PLK6-60]|uniref:hypothetical protein n=1 Tax=Micromonospora sp. PLK6-60 TaxID=2873383 RepID=UPI001CA761E1|nr:hypothetical protein [Micromonospora sp. PLK6-60]MBY8874555.1 hypothetical protein [Micromonospora sp. PLK6-60]